MSESAKAADLTKPPPEAPKQNDNSISNEKATEKPSILRRSRRAPKPVQMSPWRPRKETRKPVKKKIKKPAPFVAESDDNDDNEEEEDDSSDGSDASRGQTIKFILGLDRWVRYLAQDFPDYLEWADDGDGFIVYGDDNDLRPSLQEHFGYTKFERLRQKMSAHGFRKRHRDGAFNHPHFHRHHPLTLKDLAGTKFVRKSRSQPPNKTKSGSKMTKVSPGRSENAVTVTPPKSHALPDMFSDENSWDDSSVESFAEMDLADGSLDEILKHNARKRRHERRSNPEYVTFHRLYSAAVWRTDFVDGIYRGPFHQACLGPYGPAYLPRPSKMQRFQRTTAVRRRPVAVEAPSKCGTIPPVKAVRKRKSAAQPAGTTNQRRPKPKQSGLTTPVEKIKGEVVGQRPTTKPSGKRPILASTEHLDMTDLSKLPRGVTMRPSGRWQAQFYFNGRSRYIGVFNSSREAAYAYRVVHDDLEEIRHDDMSRETANDVFARVRLKAFREAKEAVKRLKETGDTEKEKSESPGK